MKTVCFDASNLAIRNLFGPEVITYVSGDKKKVESVNYELFKYRMIDGIYKSLFKIGSVDEVVLAMDDRRSWRRMYWTKYKANRKSARERLDLDWDDYYKEYGDYMDEIASHLPFKVINIKDSEADDVIGTLVHNKPQNFYVVSTDKDFLQLCSPRVKIFNPLKKAHVEHPNPELFLVEECLRGQAKDNIYNIRTPLNHPDGVRKPGFGAKAFEKAMTHVQGYKGWLEDNDLVDRYEFNRNLMDLSRVPNEIKRRILRDYDNYALPHPDNILTFFQNHQWPEYMERFTNVENRLLELY